MMAWRDQLVTGDSRHMAAVPDESVCLVVTSPPYNINLAYDVADDNKALPEYLAGLRQVWAECWRVLRPGGRLCINVANCYRDPFLWMPHLVAGTVAPAGDFLMRGEIIWNKSASVSESTAWGSWLQPSNPTLRDVHESITVYSKGQYQLLPLPGMGDSDLTKEEFTSWTKSVWDFQSQRRGPYSGPRLPQHPAPFPVELPRRLIKLYTFPGACIVDPFSGSGTTAVAAKLLGRSYVGYDVSAAYNQQAEARLAATVREEDRPILRALKAKQQRLPLGRGGAA